MNKYKEYITNIRDIMDKLEGSEEILNNAGKIIGDCYINGGMLYLFGTGHSHILCLEMFYRAGGFVKVYPILEEDLMLHKSAVKSTESERIEGLSKKIISNYDIKKNDVMIIFSNSGRNAVPVEMAELMKDKGVKVIAVTNLNQSIPSSSRARSGKKLYEIADIVIDNYGISGDASIRVDNDRFIAPTSTAIGAAIVNLLQITAYDYMTAKGFSPEVFMSSNVDGGDAVNNRYIEKYKSVIKPL
jgi:uncharacterized phosphosugar-binding protein